MHLTTSFALIISCVTGCLSLASLRFLSLGDWGGSPDFPYTTKVETAVADQMGAIADIYQTSFNLALGDNFYTEGVKNVEDKRFVETFENVYKAESLQNPWYLLAGNHDHKGNVSAQIAYSKVSKRWNFPYYYYKLSYKIPDGDSIDIIMLDTVLLCGNTLSDFEHDQPKGPADFMVAQDQWTWLEQQLASSKADYLMVAGHYPVYSVAEHGPTKCLVERLDPLLYKYSVTAYISGHDHNLQHLQTSKGSQNMDYFVIGAANYVEYNTDHKHDVPKGSSKFVWADISEFGGFAFFEATSKNMTFKFIDGERKELYQHVLFPRK